jgi:hypothetical protein
MKNHGLFPSQSVKKVVTALRRRHPNLTSDDILENLREREFIPTHEIIMALRVSMTLPLVY